MHDVKQQPLQVHQLVAAAMLSISVDTLERKHRLRRGPL